MTQPIELYQIQQITSNDLNALTRLINDINQQLFEISKRLGALSIPQSTTDVSTVADIVALLESAGIGED